MNKLIAFFFLGALLSAQAPAPTWGINPSAAPLPPLVQFMLAYDPVRGVLVAFGGKTHASDPAPTNRTYEYDGITWTDVTPAVSPGARHYGAMAFDPINNVMVLFGGFDTGTYLGDTWTWNGVSWTNLTGMTGMAPTPRSDHAMVTDPVNGRLFLYGGGQVIGTAPTPALDTWVFDCVTQTWSPLATTNNPGDRGGHGMAYCGVTGEIIVFGGSTMIGQTTYGDTWAWTGTDWVQKAPGAGPQPPASLYNGMCSNSATGEVYLACGYNPYLPLTSPQPDDSLWVYRGSEGWSMVPLNGTAGPGERRNCEMVEFGPGTVALVGGSRYGVSTSISPNETWVISNLDGAYPGTHPEIDVASFVGPYTGNPELTRGAGNDVKTRLASDNLLVVKAYSPNGTFNGQSLFFLAEVRGTGTPANNLGIPNVYVSPLTSIWLKSPAFGNCVLLSGGVQLGFLNPSVTIGNSVFVQAAVTNPMTGGFEISDAHEIRF